VKYEIMKDNLFHETDVKFKIEFHGDVDGSRHRKCHLILGWLRVQLNLSIQLADRLVLGHSCIVDVERCGTVAQGQIGTVALEHCCTVDVEHCCIPDVGHSGTAALALVGTVALERCCIPA